MAVRGDVGIVGGGHNGLVAAAYLARPRLPTLVCARRPIVGGAARRQPPLRPGFPATPQSSARDADRYPDYAARLARIAAILGPLLSQIPPKLGSHRPGDLIGQGLLLRNLRRVDTRLAVDITRLLTSSIADLVEANFSSDA